MPPSPLLIFKAVFAAGSLWLLLQLVPWVEIRSALAGVSPAWFAAGVMLQFLSRALATVHMKVITDSQGLGLRRRDLFRLLLSVQFYSMFLPGTLAGGGVAWLKYVEHGAGKAAAAAAVVLNRALGMLVLLPLGACAILLDPVSTGLPPSIVAGLAGLIVACVTVFWSPWPPRLAAGIARRGKLSLGAGGFLERLLLFQRIPAAGRLGVMASLVAFHLGSAAALWSFARAVGAPVSYLSVIWIHAALQAALLLPFSIAGIGIRDASLIGLGLLLGIKATTAMAWSFTILAGLIVVTSAGGLIESDAWARRLSRGARKPVPHEEGHSDP